MLDEATASLDEETDRAMQRALSSSFKGCTVLIVAHRLRTVLHCEQIVCLSGGRLVECNSPAALLANEAGALSALVADHGEAQARELRALAAAAAARRAEGNVGAV